MNNNVIMHAIAGVTSTLRQQSTMNKQASQMEELQKQAELIQMDAVISHRIAQLEGMNKEAMGIPAWLQQAMASAKNQTLSNPMYVLPGVGAGLGAGIGALAGGEGNRLMGAGLGALGGGALGAGAAYGDLPLRMYTAPKGSWL